MTDLTDAKLHPLQTLFIEYIDDLPEYPKTHINGHTYVIAANGMSQKEAEQRVQNVSTSKLSIICLETPIDCSGKIQYSRSSLHGLRHVNSTFLNCKVKKWSWKCSGAFVCEYIKPSLRLLHHTYLDDKAWQEIRTIRRDIDLVEKDILKRNALR